MLPETETLLIHCSDHRVAHACSKFVALELKEPVFDVVAVPGGPQFLRALEYMPKFTWAGRRWLRFLMESHRIRRVILIAHQDCAWYDHLHGDHEDHDARQKADLHHAASDLSEWFPGLRVESYFATGVGAEAHFDRVD
jgi:hypothetical protein